MTLADESDSEVRYRIVGADEFDPARNWISVDSPMARALLGRLLDHAAATEVAPVRWTAQAGGDPVPDAS